MAHPHQEHKQHKVERKRVAHITKNYASGGAIHEDESADKKLIKRTVKKTALKMDGKKPKHRMDHRARGGKIKRADGGVASSQVPYEDLSDAQKAAMNDAMNQMGQNRARGGRTKAKGKGTNVNVIVAPQHAMGGAPGMMPGGPPAPAAMPPHPPMAPGAPPMPPPGGMPPAGAMPPGAMPPRPGMVPGMPIRAKGGRISSGTATPSLPVPEVKKMMSGHPKFGRDEYAKGGAVKSGPAWDEGLKNGTQIQHDDGKSDGNNVGRGRVVTFWAGGKVEAPKGVAPATKLPGGAGGAKARIAKEHRAERDYAKAR